MNKTLKAALAYNAKPKCWHCNTPLAKNPKGGYFRTKLLTPSGPVDVHKICFEPAVRSLQSPHIWPSTEVRSETYRDYSK